MPESVRPQCGDPGCLICHNLKYEAQLLAYAEEHITALLVAGKSTGLSIDVGAHSGLWASNVAKWYRDAGFDNAVVLALDPGRTVPRGLEGVCTLEVAAWSSTNLMSMVGDGPTRHLSFNDGSYVVPCVKLDDLVSPDAWVDLLKVDVEGAEYHALHGAQKILERSERLIVVVEVHEQQLARFGNKPGEIFSLLGGLGYGPAYGTKYSPSRISKMVFVR